MIGTVRFAPALCLMLTLAMPAPARADIDAAIDAYDRKDYAAAIARFTELANAGATFAMTSLAHMHAHGEGTEADVGVAAKWVEKAARAGDAGAQLALGALHYHGEGVEQSLPLAYAWFNLAATNGRDESLDYMQILLEQLDGETLDKAQRLSRRLFERYGDPDLAGLLDSKDRGG